MSSNVVSRAVARKALAKLIRDNLAGDGKPIQEVYAFTVGDWGANNPIVAVTGGPATYPPTTAENKDFPSFILYVHILELYSDIANQITEEDSEDSVDAIVKAIIDLTRDHSIPIEESWYRLEPEGPTLIPLQPDTGVEYRHEIIPFRALMFDPLGA